MKLGSKKKGNNFKRYSSQIKLLLITKESEMRGKIVRLVIIKDSV